MFDENGEKVTYNYTSNTWEYPDGDVNIHGKKTKLCPKCNKPSLDINGVEDVDFCLQGLTTCSFIDNACCGHGDDSIAYISFKDGRRWILDPEWNMKIKQLDDNMEGKRFCYDSELGFIDYQNCGGDVLLNNEVVDLLNELDADRQTYLTMAVKLAKKLGFKSSAEFHDKIKEGYLD